MKLDLAPFLQIPQTALILMAPPAWGKTRLLLDLVKDLDKTFVFLSPLRALAEEFYPVMSCYRTTLLLREIERKSLLKNVFYITTPEEWRVRTPSFDHENTIFIFDEFHLFYYWGETFRPKMREVYEDLACCGANCLFLSATMNGEHLLRFKNEVEQNFTHSYQIDLGNQQLKNFPRKTYYYPNIFKNHLANKLKRVLQGEGKTILVLVHSRAEVDYWVDYARNSSISVLGCKGGEAQEFSQNLALVLHPRLIVATSVLSHGVNLPEIEQIFILTKLKNIDFWIQYVGRGGRKGEKYTLHTMDSYFLPLTRKIASIGFILLQSLCYKLVSLYE